jgi:hypothetical protein
MCSVYPTLNIKLTRNLKYHLFGYIACPWSHPTSTEIIPFVYLPSCPRARLYWLEVMSPDTAMDTALPNTNSGLFNIPEQAEDGSNWISYKERMLTAIGA